MNSKPNFQQSFKSAGNSCVGARAAENTLPPAVPLTSSLLPAPANVTPHVFPPQPRPYVYVLPAPSTSGPHSQPTATKVPYSTQSYRKKKQREEQSSDVPTKRYKGRTGPTVCSKCGQPRTE